MPSIRLLDLANLVALSPSKHFFNRLRGAACAGELLAHGESPPVRRQAREVHDPGHARVKPRS